jgi:hypothetical protein
MRWNPKNTTIFVIDAPRRTKTGIRKNQKRLGHSMTTDDLKKLDYLLYAIKFDADDAVNKRVAANFYADTNALNVFKRISGNVQQARDMLEKIKKETQ